MIFPAMNSTRTRLAAKGGNRPDFLRRRHRTGLFQRGCCVFGAFLTTLVFSHAAPDIYPSEAPFELLSGTTGGTTVAAADTGINITFAPGSGYPGVTWKATESWDWSAAVQLAVTLTNTGTSSTQLYYIAKDNTGKELYAGFTGPTLEAGKTYTILTDLTRQTAQDCKSVYGMNFPPPAVSGDNVWLNDQHGTMDLGKVVSFRIFMQKPPTEPVTINVKSIKLYKPSPIQAFYTGIIDPFGQYTHATWPGKITNASDLAARLASENEDIAAHPKMPDRDEYGAWTGGEKVSPAPGFFQAVNRSGKWWLVAPNGNLFLSFGFNCMWPGGTKTDNGTVTEGREYMFQTIPTDVHAGKSRFQYGPFKGGPFNIYDFYGANVDKKYGAKYGSGDYIAGWNAQAFKRMQSWGFNTIANWSDTRPESLQAEDRLPYTVVLTSVAGSRVGRDHVTDPYDPGFATKTEERIKGIITPKMAGDPWVLGYYCDNEIRWCESYPEWSGNLITVQNRYTLAIDVLAAAPTQPAKMAFQSQMQAKYGAIDSLNAAWGTKFDSWEEFLKPYKVPTAPKDGLIADMGSFTQAYAAKYATTIKSIIKKYDPNHLYLGCRFSFSSPEIIKGIAQEGGADVVSFNIYANTLEPALWDFTKTLGKPCIVSEYHFGAQGGGLFGYGNGTAARALDQKDRAEKYTVYMKSLLATPAFVGAHWFQFTDEPVTGRNFDGENYNIGFVDVADTPYALMVDAARSVHAQAYALHQASAAP
jgi:hypothetical protein